MSIMAMRLFDDTVDGQKTYEEFCWTPMTNFPILKTILINTPTQVTRSASDVSRILLLLVFLSAYKTLDLEEVVDVFEKSLLIPPDDDADDVMVGEDGECFAMAYPNPFSFCQYRTKFRRNVSVEHKPTMLIAKVIQSAR